MATTRAKFRCNGIHLSRTSILNPELMAEYEKEHGRAPGYRELQELAEEKGVPHTLPFDQPRVELAPVAGEDSPENRTFWEATPMGKIEMTINNPAAAELFELGKDYYVDFTPAD